MLPFFYQENLEQQLGTFILDEPTSKYCVQVLRMQAGEALNLTNGKGVLAEAVITAAERKHCMVEIQKVELIEARPAKFSLAIAFTKNNSRNEWLLEKVTELGIENIYPIITQRTEKDKFKFERLNGILTAGMLQSQQAHLPVLHEPMPFKTFVKTVMPTFSQKYIGHCIESSERKSYINTLIPGEDVLMLVGPEGDFTPDEIEMALQQGGATPVVLGKNRLRTETAGLYACTVFNAKNYAQ